MAHPIHEAYYLPLHGEDGLAGGVEEDAAVADAEDGALDPQHDGAVGVGDGEVAVGEADGLLGHRQGHHVRRAELRGHHRHRGRRRRRRASVVGRRQHILPQNDRRRLGRWQLRGSAR